MYFELRFRNSSLCCQQRKRHATYPASRDLSCPHEKREVKETSLPLVFRGDMRDLCSQGTSFSLLTTSGGAVEPSPPDPTLPIYKQLVYSSDSGGSRRSRLGKCH